MRRHLILLTLLPAAFLAGPATPSVRLVPVDPVGACRDSYLALNLNSGNASQCVNGAWRLAREGRGVPAVGQLPKECTPYPVPPLVLLASGRSAFYACMAPNRWTQTGPECKRADEFESLEAAVAAVHRPATIVLPSGYAAHLRRPLELQGDQLTVRCLPGAHIQKEFAGDAIHVVGRNVAIEGCRMEAAPKRFGGGMIRLNDCEGVSIANSVVTGASGIAIAIYTSRNVAIERNTIEGNGGSPLFAQDGLEDIVIAGNTMDSSAASPPNGIDTIGIHTYQDGGWARNLHIRDNVIVHGGDNFAVEIGAFGAHASAPANVTVERNRIRLARDSNGAISFSTLHSGAIAENQINADGHAIHIDAVELVSTNNVRVLRNTLSHTSESASYTLAINGGSRNAVEGNRWEGGIYVGTSRAEAAHVDENEIRDNVLVERQAAMSRGLIWFQCNTFNCSVSRNRVSANQVTGNGSGPAVLFENDCGAKGGVVEENVVEGNRVAGATQPVSIGPSVTGTQIR